MELQGIPEHHLPAWPGSPGLGTAAKVYVLREMWEEQEEELHLLGAALLGGEGSVSLP